MKKFLVILAAIMLVSSASARTDITMSQGSTWNEVVVNYNCSTEPNLVRAFALDITVTNGAITNAGTYNAKYWVYPGSIDINATTGDVNTYGTPIASYAIDTLDGIGTNGITVEMGSLYAAGDGNQPATSGTLLKFTVSMPGTVCIAENVIRGGVVLENPDAVADVNAPCYTVGLPPDCPALTGKTAQLTAYNQYRNYGWVTEAESWCAAYHCVGDADSATSGFPYNYRIFTGDLSLIVNNWRLKMGQKAVTGPQPYADPRADVDHKSSGFPYNYRVFTGDLQRVVNNWRQKSTYWTTQPPCPLSDTANNTYTGGSY